MTRKKYAIIHFIIPFLIWIFCATMTFLNLENQFLDLLIHCLVGFFGVITGRTLGQLFSYKIPIIDLYPFYFEFILLGKMLSFKNIDVSLLKEKYKR